MSNYDLNSAPDVAVVERHRDNRMALAVFAIVAVALIGAVLIFVINNNNQANSQAQATQATAAAQQAAAQQADLAAQQANSQATVASVQAQAAGATAQANAAAQQAAANADQAAQRVRDAQTPPPATGDGGSGAAPAGQD